MNTNLTNKYIALVQAYTALTQGFRALFLIKDLKNGRHLTVKPTDDIVFYLDPEYHFDLCDEEGHDEDETEVTSFCIRDGRILGVTNSGDVWDLAEELDEKELEDFLDVITDADNIDSTTADPLY